MKKIPTIYKREFVNGKIVNVWPEVNESCIPFMIGHCVATIKKDGSCCAILNGKLYVRYDAKKGKTPPPDAIPCEPAPDPITGHWPHWIPAKKENSSHKWYFKALENFIESGGIAEDCTYEAIGPHFNGNPYSLQHDILYRHGSEVVQVPQKFIEICEWLKNHDEEGLVFWYNGEPLGKIKRTDFGFAWPANRGDKI